MKRLIESALPITLLLCAAPALAQGWDAPPPPPAGAMANQQIPARDGFGRYATPNVGLSAAETGWHVRAALNVAALGCRGPQDGWMAVSYNTLLVRHRDPLAAADQGTKALYRQRHGAGWADVHDRSMTRLYNFFSQVPAHEAFCAAASDILAQAETLAPGDYPAFAAWALPRLEAPFTDFYRAYDDWRVADRTWRDGHALAAIPPGTLQR